MISLLWWRWLLDAPKVNAISWCLIATRIAFGLIPLSTIWLGLKSDCRGCAKRAYFVGYCVRLSYMGKIKLLGEKYVGVVIGGWSCGMHCASSKIYARGNWDKKKGSKVITPEPESLDYITTPGAWFGGRSCIRVGELCIKAMKTISELSSLALCFCS